MTEKELHKLRRQDLLQLLLAQGREAAQLQARISELSEELERLQETNARFIDRMDDKDIQIERLKSRLDEKDVQAERFKERLGEKDSQIAKLKHRLDQKDIQIGECRSVIEEYRSGRIFEMGGRVSIAEVGQKLEGIFTAAQKAVDQYLEEIHGTIEFRSFGTDGGNCVSDSMERDTGSWNGGPGTEAREEEHGFGGAVKVCAEMIGTEEQHEKETEGNSDGDSDTGAAGGRAEEGTVQAQLRACAAKHGILPPGGGSGGGADSGSASAGSPDQRNFDDGDAAGRGHRGGGEYEEV
jgi:hypothetical protein